MPSTSLKQKKFMDAAAHNPAFAKKAGIPVKVAKEFSTASKGQKFQKGGDTMASKMNPGFMAMMAKKKAGAKKEMPMKAGGAKKMMGGGMAYAKGGSASARADGIAKKGKTKGTQIKMKSGGMAC
jgi:hypothetical protein